MNHVNRFKDSSHTNLNRKPKITVLVTGAIGFIGFIAQRIVH